MPSQLFPDQVSIPSFKELVLYTGNVLINSPTGSKSWNKKSNTELLQAISNTLQVSLHGPNGPSYRHIKETNVLEIPNSRLSNSIQAEDRKDLEVTAKLFCLEDYNETYISNALSYLQQLLNIKTIDRFILSIEENKLDGAWKELEEYQTNGIISELGVSDFDHKQLTEFIQKSDLKVKPALNQVSLDASGALPIDLIQLGQSNQIEITYNSDTSDILSTKSLGQLLKESHVVNEETQVQPSWVLKYDVFYKKRSVVADKGYIIVGNTI